MNFPVFCPVAEEVLEVLYVCTQEKKRGIQVVMAEVPIPSTNTVWKSVKPFFNGGLSGMLATCVIQPIDMVKVRIQLGATGSPVRTRQHSPHLQFEPDRQRCR